MERDAPLMPSIDDVVPPVRWETVRSVGLAGLGLTATAAVLGLVATALPDPPWILATARLLLVAVGAVTAGGAVSLRADLPQAWLLGVAAAVAAVFGTPAHWDSFRLLFGVLAVLGLTGAAVAAARPEWRFRVISLAVLFHFGGIFLATTAPPPSPWVTDQVYQRVYNPYLHFIYMRNAYHFYSPEPGPASLVCCLLKTETGEEVLPNGERRKTYDQKWIVMPKRPADVKDPLGLTYYRRLSLTEQVARAIPDIVLPEMFEKHEVKNRRVSETTIPFHPGEPIYLQYRLPNPDILRFLLPSYAQHVILTNTPDPETAAKTTVKIYRVEHRLLGAPEFIKGMNPYHPTTYKPYFVGEFDVYGNLLNPQEPMLYWLVPVIPRPTPDEKGRTYLDFLSEHAGLEFEWGQLR